MSLSSDSNSAINGAIKDFIEQKIERYGPLYYCYLTLNKRNPKELLLISNYSEAWVDHYRNHNFQHTDPIVITALSRISPFSWDEISVIKASNTLANIFGTAAKYDTINGYTFVLHDYNNHLALLSFILPGANADEVKSMMDRKKDELQMLLINTFDKDIANRKASPWFNQNNMDKRTIFTKRENEILYWASMGKTYHEIGSILGLKTTTIKFHIGNAVKKLGVANAKHAIRLGIELQLIKPLA